MKRATKTITSTNAERSVAIVSRIFSFLFVLCGALLIAALLAPLSARGAESDSFTTDATHTGASGGTAESPSFSMTSTLLFQQPVGSLSTPQTDARAGWMQSETGTYQEAPAPSPATTTTVTARRRRGVGMPSEESEKPPFIARNDTSQANESTPPIATTPENHSTTEPARNSTAPPTKKATRREISERVLWITIAVIATGGLWWYERRKRPPKP